MVEDGAEAAPPVDRYAMGWLIANRTQVGFILQPEDGLL